jgi:hypothetical protein
MVSSRRNIISGLTIATVLLSGGQQLAVPCWGHTVREVLSSFGATTRPWGHCACRVETTGTGTIIKKGVTIKAISERAISVACIDGIHIDSTDLRWNWGIGEKRPNFDPATAYRTRDIWDGKTEYSYMDMGATNSQGLTISDPKTSLPSLQRAESHNFNIERPNSPMLGVFTGADDKSIFDLLRDPGAKNVTCKAVALNGEPCDLIGATTPEGRYSIWFDPKRGFNIVKLVVRKAGSDLFYGQPLDKPLSPDVIPVYKQYHYPMPPIRSLTYEMYNVKLSQAGGIWFTSTADFKITTVYTDGEDIHTGNYHLLSVDFSPDFAKLGAFVPSFPDGTPVTISGQKPSAIPLCWQDGKVVPAVDSQLRSRLDQEIKDAIKDVGPRPPPGNGSP